MAASCHRNDGEASGVEFSEYWLIARGWSDKLQPASLLHFNLKFAMIPSRTSLDPPSTIHQGLSREQVATFERDGYLLIPNALDSSTVSSLLRETHAMLENFSLEDHPMTKFSTGEGTEGEHVGDEYFITSGDKIRFFFEEGQVGNRCLEIRDFPNVFP